MSRRNVTSRRQEVYEDVLAAANCTSLECLRSASPEVLVAANYHLISEVPSGAGGGSFGPSIGFAPSPDGVYIRDEPMVLLQDSSTAHRQPLRQLLVGNMAHDGMNLINDNNMPAAFGDLVRAVFTTASNQTIQQIQDLFPFPSSKPEKLAWDWATSIIFACHSQSIAAAYPEIAHRYVMDIPPATHAQDLAYMFFLDNTTTPVTNAPLVRQMQEYLLRFVAAHNATTASRFPVYGSDSKVTLLTETGLKVQRDPWVTNGVCDKLLTLMEEPENGV
ncbi:hypothetical protein EYZ11_012901 [Aspergillus tanneri]|nr:hypothetical protein EYZ11_012901 [Aspergillus tanneri]